MNIVVIQAVNYSLSFLMWMIIGRGVLRLIIGRSPNLMALAFERVTDPVYRLTTRVLPFVAARWVPVAAFLLIAVTRTALVVALHPGAGR